LLQKAYPHLKIVLLSVDANDEAAAKEAGADFVYKGAPPDELIATLTQLLRKDTYNDDHHADSGGKLSDSPLV
jgi:DNA-binding NarL/FixJ family response regulator